MQLKPAEGTETLHASLLMLDCNAHWNNNGRRIDQGSGNASRSASAKPATPADHEGHLTLTLSYTLITYQITTHVDGMYGVPRDGIAYG